MIKNILQKNVILKFIGLMYVVIRILYQESLHISEYVKKQINVLHSRFQRLANNSSLRECYC